MKISSLLTVALLAAVLSCSDLTDSAYGPPLTCPDSPLIHYGDATYYRADGRGSCSFDSTGDVLIGAMNGVDFAEANICGAAVSVSGPEGTIEIHIVDSCPECPRGAIDLSADAFSMIADTLAGRVPISWHIVPRKVTGPVRYRFKDSINLWWSAVQIRNHRYPIHNVEYRTQQGSYVPLRRAPYNYFEGVMNMGGNPFAFRVTDIYGHRLEDSAIVPQFGTDIPGKGQFPICPSHFTGAADQ